jgi:hypothetical protein
MNSSWWLCKRSLLPATDLYPMFSSVHWYWCDRNPFGLSCLYVGNPQRAYSHVKLDRIKRISIVIPIVLCVHAVYLFVLPFVSITCRNKFTHHHHHHHHHHHPSQRQCMEPNWCQTPFCAVPRKSAFFCRYVSMVTFKLRSSTHE